jgi:hypothetical protein
MYVYIYTIVFFLFFFFFWHQSSQSRDASKDPTYDRVCSRATLDKGIRCRVLFLSLSLSLFVINDRS